MANVPEVSDFVLFILFGVIHVCHCHRVYSYSYDHIDPDCTADGQEELYGEESGGLDWRHWAPPAWSAQIVGEALEVVHNMDDGKVEEEVGEEMWDEKGGVDVLTEDYLKSLPPGWWVEEVQVGVGSVVKKVVDSRGKEFMGRIAAVRKAKQQDRGGLDFEGWVVPTCLDSAPTSPCWLVGQA